MTVSEHEGAGSVINVVRESGATPSSGCCPGLTMQITFAGIETCPGFTDISINGTFTLTRADEGAPWAGMGGQADFGSGPVDLDISLTCGSGPDFPVAIFYSGFGFACFSVSAVPMPTPRVIDNQCDCGSCFGQGGTATLICA